MWCSFRSLAYWYDFRLHRANGSMTGYDGGGVRTGDLWLADSAVLIVLIDMAFVE